MLIISDTYLIHAAKYISSKLNPSYVRLCYTWWTSNSMI